MRILKRVGKLSFILKNIRKLKQIKSRCLRVLSCFICIMKLILHKSYHNIASLEHDLLFLKVFHEGNKYYMTIKFKKFYFSNRIYKIF